MVSHTLEIAGGIFLLASKRHLGTLLSKQPGDLLVGNSAHLVVVVDDLAILVADATFTSLHQCVAGLVAGADVAIDSFPAFVTITRSLAAHRTVLATGERSTYC